MRTSKWVAKNLATSTPQNNATCSHKMGRCGQNLTTHKPTNHLLESFSFFMTQHQIISIFSFHFWSSNSRPLSPSFPSPTSPSHPHLFTLPPHLHSNLLLFIFNIRFEVGFHLFSCVLVISGRWFLQLYACFWYFIEFI